MSYSFSAQLPGWGPIGCRMDPRWEAVRHHRIAKVPGLTNPREVHAYVRRRVQYHSEPIDIWATPEETLKRGYGDCEDFAILERALLIESGWPREDIWVLLAHDLLVRQDHALLIVGGLIIDCRSAPVFPVSTFRDYRPIIAFCEDRAVTFGRKRQ